VTPNPPEPKRKKKVEPEAIAVVEPTPEPAPAPEPEPTPAPFEIPATPAPLPELVEDTVESTLTSVGATYEQLVKLATELNWWPTPEAYPTANDLTDDLKKWVIRNKRGIGRAVQKAGGAL